MQVIDAAGDPFERGFPVTFAVSSGPANTSVSPTSVDTDIDGYASTNLTAGETIGAIQVTATASGLSGSPVTFNASVVPGAAATMVVNGGDGQLSAVGTVLSTNPSVLVTDDNGDPVPDVIVTFSVTSGGGSVTGSVDTTDVNGIATVGSWTLGTAVGENTLSASATGLSPVVFTATGTAGGPTVLAIVAGDGQSGAGGATLAQPLVVGLTDQYGNPVVGVQVIFATSFGSVDPLSAQTDAAGYSQTAWTLDPDSTDQTATATVTGITPVTFTATLSVGAQNIAIVDGNNQTATVGATLPVSPSVLVTDGGGNPAPDEQVVFAVASGGGSVTGDTVLTDGEGMAQVGGWTLGAAVGTNTLTATVGGLTPVTFTATGTVDVANAVVIVSGNAQTADGGTDLPLPLVVEVQDQYGNPVPGETVDWQALNGSVTPTSSTTDGAGQAQTTWMLGMNSTSQTASATVGALTPAIFTATATFPTPTILLALVGADRVSVGSTADLEITLSAPAGVGGVTVTVTSDNSGIVAVQAPEMVTIAEGNTTGQVVLDGVAGGSTTIRANATGYTEGTLVVESSLQVLSLPSTLNVGFGATASLPLTISTPAPAGGEAVTLLSDNPSAVALEASTVTILEGSFTANATVSGVLPGTATITATSATHGSAQSTVSTTANLNITQGSLTIDETFGSSITIQLESGGVPIAAPSPGIVVTLTPADPTCVTATSPVTIPTGLVDITSAVSYGGSATTQCNSTLTASATDITSDAITVYVNPPPAITVPTGTNANTASGLQRNQTGYLGASNHGGVDVVIKSSDPSILRISPDANTPGADSIIIPVADGYNYFYYHVQGMEDTTGTVTVTATSPLFSDGTTTSTVVQPGVYITGVNTTTTSLSNDDPFYAEIGIPYSTYVYPTLAVRAGAPGPLTVTFVSSDPSVGQLVDSVSAAGSLTAQIAEGQTRTPTSVANGGVAVDPLGPGTTTISASIPGYVSTPSAAYDVTVSAPAITVTTGTNATTASGLQRSQSASLGASNHGGVDVVIKSSDPGILRISPDQATPGTDSIIVPVADGSTYISYYIQGMEDTTGTVTVTATSPLFTDGTATGTVVQPGVQLQSIGGAITSLSDNDPFYAEVGIPYSTYVYPTLALRAGAPGPLIVTFTNSDPSVGQLVDSVSAAGSLTAQITEGQLRTPTTVANGGVAFDPLGPGTTTVSASIPGYVSTTNAARDVTVSAPGITLSTGSNANTASGLQRSQSGVLGAANHGGVDVVIKSSDPGILRVSPDNTTPGTDSIVVTVADGSTYFYYYVQGIEDTTGTVTVTATATAFTDGTATSTVVQPGVYIAGLNTTTTSLSANDDFYAEIGIPYSTYVYPTLQLRAGSPAPLTVTLTSSAPSVGQLVDSTLAAPTVTVEISEGQYRSPTTVTTGGAAFDPLTAGTTTVSAAIAGFVSTPLASVDVTVSAPEVTLYSTITGSGLQRSISGYMTASDHGGVDVVITSSNPSVLLLSPNDTTAGTAFISIPVADGYTGFSYYVQGVEDATGTVTLTATADGFTDGTNTIDVVQPAFDISSLSTSFTTLDNDDPFQIRVGLPYSGDAYVQYALAVRAGAPSPLSVTVTSSAPSIGQLVTTQTTGGSVTVEIAPGSSNSPTSVAADGVAFEPLDAGTTTVTATIPGFRATANGSLDVAVAASGINMSTTTVGAGLQTNVSAQLDGPDHGGVDVVITSSDPSTLLVSPNATTPGTASITVAVADGSTSVPYYVQGVEGQTGTVTVTATAPGFTDGTTTKDVVQPAINLYSIYTTMTTAYSDDPFRVQVGIPDIDQNYMQTYQDVRAGAPSSYTATVTSSNAAVGELITTAATGGSVEVLIVEGEYYTPNTVATGGVAIRPLSVGTTTVTATIPGFVTLPASANGSVDVTVITP